MLFLFMTVDFSKFETRLIMYKSMMQHKSILGKKKTITCFVITGNGNGILGNIIYFKKFLLFQSLKYLILLANIIYF